MRSVFTALIILAVCTFSASGAVFQYTAAVTTDRGESAAFLWVPPGARQVRGVVAGGMTLMEREFAKDARIRQACADQQLAIVFLKCGLGRADLQAVLDDLAKVSAVGMGMRVHTGVGERMFAALGDARINIHNITTSEIKISCLIDRDQGKRALRVVHDAFELGTKPRRKPARKARRKASKR